MEEAREALGNKLSGDRKLGLQRSQQQLLQGDVRLLPFSAPLCDYVLLCPISWGVQLSRDMRAVQTLCLAGIGTPAHRK